MIKTIVRYLYLPLLINLVACNPLYIGKLGIEEFKILRSRKSIQEELLLDNNNQSSLPRETIEKLKLVKEIRDFSKEIGLEPRDSYTTYSDLNDLKPIFVVTAAKRLLLEPVTWWYPFVGSIPYKGYFDKEDAIEFKTSLDERDYDTAVRNTVAYSTLGWFNDPVLPSILKQSDLNIIITVFHEITHSTIWIKGHPDFNETLAEATGLISSLEFIKNKRPELLNDFKKRYTYECMLSILLDNTYGELTELYSSNRAKEEKLNLKRQIYENLIIKAQEIKKEILSNPSDNIDKQQKEEEFNNATFISTYIYFKKLTLFLEFYQNMSSSSPSLFLNSISKLNKSDPYEDLKKLVESANKDYSKFNCLDIKF